ncbi:MAG: DUF2490 domain-containing protein [Fulvivirga sp.]|nr:DUF2490 domain-containing protein [Fulvivirga sp.]
MVKRTAIALSLFCLLAPPILGQERTVQRDNFKWLTYNFIKTLDKGVSISLAFQPRRYAFPDRQHQFFSLLAVRKQYASGIKIGAGFCYFLQALPINRNDVDIVRPELRPLQEISYASRINKLNISHRMMLEERWFQNIENDELVSGYEFQFRFRYRVMVTRALDKHADWTAITSLEPMLNGGNPDIRNVFDQVRAFIGAKRKLSDNFSATLGYLYWYQQFPTVTDFGSFHIIHLKIDHKL